MSSSHAARTAQAPFHTTGQHVVYLYEELKVRWLAQTAARARRLQLSAAHCVAVCSSSLQHLKLIPRQKAPKLHILLCGTIFSGKAECC